MVLTSNGYKYFIKMSGIARSSCPGPDPLHIAMTKLQTPLPNALGAHVNTTASEQFFNITEAQSKAVIQSYGVADNVCRVAVTYIAIICVFHLVIMPKLGPFMMIKLTVTNILKVHLKLPEMRTAEPFVYNSE